MSQSPLHDRVKKMIIEELKLEDMRPEDIDGDAPLFGEGLGLDSIDALTLVVGIDKEFGVKIKDEGAGDQAFRSVNAMVEFLRSQGVVDTP
jgi:acyl carrier protein